MKKLAFAFAWALLFSFGGYQAHAGGNPPPPGILSPCYNFYISFAEDVGTIKNISTVNGGVRKDVPIVRTNPVTLLQEVDFRTKTAQCPSDIIFQPGDIHDQLFVTPGGVIRFYNFPRPVPGGATPGGFNYFQDFEYLGICLYK